MSRGSSRLCLFSRIATLAVFAMSTCVATAAAQADRSPIGGRVLNGSADGSTVQGARVNLYALDGANRRLVTMTTSDPTGRYLFDALPSGLPQRYEVSASNDGVEYGAQVPDSGAGARAAVDITVYPATADSQAISVQRLSIVLASVDRKAGLLTFVESYHVLNAAPATYVGEARAGQLQTLQFPLVAGARGLSALEGFGLGDVLVSGQGFALTSPVFPGPSVFSFSYDVPYHNQSLRMRHSVAYPTALAEIILPSDLRISSSQLNTTGSVQLGGRSFETIQAKDLTPATSIDVQVEGLPPRPPSPRSFDSQPVDVAAVLAIVAIAAATVALRRSRPLKAGTLGSILERDELLQLIAQLDESAERGEIEREEYRQARANALTRLASLRGPSQVVEKSRTPV